MAKENPFVFGKVVTGSRFADREEETEFIRRQVHSHQNIVLISPRRYGKTSLVVTALSGTDYIYVDCSLADSPESFVEEILNSAVKGKPVDFVVKEIKKILKNIEVTVEFKPFQIKVSNMGQAGLKEVFDYISKRTVVFDEFQDIVNISPSFPKKLRSIIQHQKNSYIFLGSRRHMMEKIFQKQNSPFYNIGAVLRLEKIPLDKFEHFIIHWFKETKVPLETQDIKDVLSLTQGHPYYTQHLCNFLWENRISGGKKSVEDILNTILDMNRNFYEMTYSQLTGNQKKALHIAAKETEMFRYEIITKYRLKTAQNLQKALNSLVRKEILDKNSDYHFVDLFFKKWLLYQTV